MSRIVSIRPVLTGVGVVGLGAAFAWLQRHLRSEMVRAWHPSQHQVQSGSPLASRAFGHGPDTVVLLHGLGATSDFWGGTYDRLGRDHRVLIPDLLGFGRSLDETRADFSIDAHLDALDALLDQQAPDTERLMILAHSMGSRVAVAWALRRPDLASSVMCAGAPIYPSARAARVAVGEVGTMARLFLLDTTWAQRACALSCAHRSAAALLTVIAEPRLPVAVARRSPLHTWPAYRDALDQFILDVDWPDPLAALAERDIPLTLVWGDQDPIGDVDYTRSIVAEDTQRIVVVPDAEHHLPVTHAGTIIDLLLGDLKPPIGAL